MFGGAVQEDDCAILFISVPGKRSTMVYRGIFLFLVIAVMVLPAAAVDDQNDLNIHSDAEYVPVIYITDTGDYTSSLPLIPLVKARQYYDTADYLETWNPDDVIVLNALDTGDGVCRDRTEALSSFAVSGGSGDSGDIRGFGDCCAETIQKEVYLPDLLQGVLFSVTDLCSSLNNPPYYLVDLGQNPVGPVEFSPSNNFVSAGSTDHHFQLYVPREKRHLWVDLEWSGPEMGYELTIYPPDSVIGPFEDAADGKMNQRIYLDISASPQLTPGMWYYTVTNLNGGDSNFNFTNYY